MTLEPGIYKATVRGVPDQIMLVQDDGSCFTVSLVNAWWRHQSEHVTDARPLILLDLEDAPHINGQGAKLDPVQWLRDSATLEGKTPRGGLLRWIADQIEAQSKPPRIEEPRLWGVVEALSAPSSRYRTEFIHRSDTPDSHHWARVGDGDVFAWDSLIDPTLIREGI